jgi:hypothetical protein
LFVEGKICDDMCFADHSGHASADAWRRRPKPKIVGSCNAIGGTYSWRLRHSKAGDCWTIFQGRVYDVPNSVNPEEGWLIPSIRFETWSGVLLFTSFKISLVTHFLEGTQ